jgi:hypothetical protein
VSQTRAEELLQAVRAFMREELLPQLKGFSAYSTRVAANSLGIVEREMRLGPELSRLDARAASRFALDSSQGPVTQQLAVKLRDGQVQVDDALMDYLRQRTLTALAIDNPRYWGYQQARERWQGKTDREQN